MKMRNVLRTGMILGLSFYCNIVHAVIIEVTKIDQYGTSGTQGDPLYISTHPQYLDSETNSGVFVTTPFFGNSLWGEVYESFDNPGEYVTTPIGYQDLNGTDGYSFTLSAGEVAFSICIEMGTASCLALLAVFEDQDQDGVWNPVDSDNDGIPGTAYNNGFFPGITFALTGVTPVPLPASLWLFAGGLLVLFSRKKTNKSLNQIGAKNALAG